MGVLVVPLFFLLVSSYATAQLCEQCDTSKAAFFATSSGLSSGACGYGSFALNMYGGHLAAARQNIYSNAQGCGACYQIRCENRAVCSKAGTNIVVTDYHNAKTNFTDFVLSSRAFRAMALPGKDKTLLGLGIVDVEYKRVPCVYKGQNLAIRVEEFSKPPNYIAIKVLYQGGQTKIVGAELAGDWDSSLGFFIECFSPPGVPCVYKGQNLAIRVEEFSKPPNYIAIKVLYQGGQTKIVGAEVAGVDIPSNWVSMKHNYGAVWDTSAAPKGSLQLRFIVYSGFDAQYFYTNQVLPAKWKPGVVYNTTVQIDNVAIEKCKACKGFKP